MEAAQSDCVEGPYTLVDVFRPNDHDSRDQTIFVDSDGKAYHFCATGMNTNINIAQLSDDYLAPTTTEKQVLLGDRYEAPAIFKVGDCYFGLFSGCTGWDPNAGRLAYTLGIFDTWNHRKDVMQNYSYGENFCTDDDAYYTYHSQSTCVFPVHGKEHCYIYMGDRWNSSKVASSKYVWLPLSVRSGYPRVRYYDSWDLSIFDNMYRYKRLAMASEDADEPLFADGTEVVLLEKRSDRIVSRPKQTFVIDNDGDGNTIFMLRTAGAPYHFRLQEKTSGNFLKSVFGSMRLSAEKEGQSQVWYFELEEDGYFRISNAADGKCFSLSGNSTLAETSVFLHERSSDIAQSFGIYYDSADHPDYAEADLFSRSYREQNRDIMGRQSTAMGLVHPHSNLQNATMEVHDLQGRKVNVNGNVSVQKGVYIVNGKKVVIK